MTVDRGLGGFGTARVLLTTNLPKTNNESKSNATNPSSRILTFRGSLHRRCVYYLRYCEGLKVFHPVCALCTCATRDGDGKRGRKDFWRGMAIMLKWVLLEQIFERKINGIDELPGSADKYLYLSRAYTLSDRVECSSIFGVAWNRGVVPERSGLEYSEVEAVANNVCASEDNE
jgi:hypothetical protein